MQQPCRQPISKEAIEISPSDYIGTGSGNFPITVDAVAGRILAGHSGLGLASTGHLWAIVKLPENFSRFEGVAVRVITRRVGVTNSFTITVSKNGTPDATINGASIMPGLATTYQTFELSMGSYYLAGDILLIDIRSTTDTLETNQVAGLWVEYARRT